MEIDETTLSQIVSSLERLEARLERLDDRAQRSSEQDDRIASLTANLILLLKRTDAQTANGRLQSQATLNQVNAGLAQLHAILTTPEVLAASVERPTLDRARQIKRKNTIALTGHDPVEDRGRDITLVSIRLSGAKKSVRMSRRQAFAVISAVWGALGWLAHHLITLKWH